jgi:hypothetical protein
VVIRFENPSGEELAGTREGIAIEIPAKNKGIWRRSAAFTILLLATNLVDLLCDGACLHRPNVIPHWMIKQMSVG